MRILAISMVAILWIGSAGGQSRPADSFQQLRRDYQVLARDYQQLLAGIHGNAARFGEINRKFLIDLVQNFIQNFSDEPGDGEKMPDNPLETAKRYADYALQLRDEFKVLAVNRDFQQRLTELSLRGQNLEFRGRVLQRVRDTPESRSPVASRPPVPPPPSPRTAEPLRSVREKPDPRELDKAVFQMDKDDKKNLQDYNARSDGQQRQALVDAMNQANERAKACITVFSACSSKCMGGRTIQADLDSVRTCNDCSAENVATRRAIDAVTEFDRARK